jgi:hypothetical protein
MTHLGGPLPTHLCRLSNFTSIDNLVTTIIHLTACRYVPKHLAIKLDVVSDKTHDGWRLEFLILVNSRRGLALGPCTLCACTGRGLALGPCTLCACTGRGLALGPCTLRACTGRGLALGPCTLCACTGRGLALGPCTLRACTVALYFLFYVHACCAHSFIDIVQLYFPNYQMWGVANRRFVQTDT